MPPFKSPNRGQIVGDTLSVPDSVHKRPTINDMLEYNRPQSFYLPEGGPTTQRDREWWPKAKAACILDVTGGKESETLSGSFTNVCLVVPREKSSEKSVKRQRNGSVCKKYQVP